MTSTILGTRLAISAIVTGLVAAIVLPVAVHLTADVHVDLELEASTLFVALQPLRTIPPLGAVPGLLGMILGILAIAFRPGRLPLAFLGIGANMVALVICVILVLSTLAPLYEYQEL